MSPPTTLASLQAAKQSLAISLANETAYQTQYGPRPSYSLDGESYDWPGWRMACLTKIEKLNTLIQLEAGPFEVRSLARG